MVSLEQIKKLETRVSQAVSAILELREENTTLRGKLEKYQERIDQLELLITQYRDSQQEIEEGILNALQQLDHLEDDVVKASSSNEKSRDKSPPQTLVGKQDIEGKPVIPILEEEEAIREEGKDGELDIF